MAHRSDFLSLDVFFLSDQDQKIKVAGKKFRQGSLDGRRKTFRNDFLFKLCCRADDQAVFFQFHGAAVAEPGGNGGRGQLG